MVETTGQCKEGMNIDYKSQWGRHPLVFSLANTGEPLYVVNRPGSRPSHEQAAATFDKAIALCLRAGFKRVRLRGDQDFSQTGHLDGWHAAGVKCIFGLRAAQNLDEHVENLPRNAWRELVRPAKHRVKTEPRRRPTNVKQQVVEDRCFKDIRLVEEYVAASVTDRSSVGESIASSCSGRISRCTKAAKAIQRQSLLLLHHQRLSEVGRGDRAGGESPLPSGESLRPSHE